MSSSKRRRNVKIQRKNAVGAHRAQNAIRKSKNQQDSLTTPKSSNTVNQFLKKRWFYVLLTLLLFSSWLLVSILLLRFNTKGIPLSMLAILFGVIFELYRRIRDLQSVVILVLVCYLFSLAVFFPSKHELNYNIQEHIKVWPYFFMGAVLFGIGLVSRFSYRMELSEGGLLIQSLSMVYLFWDPDLFSVLYTQTSMGLALQMVWFIIASILALVSVFHAFSYQKMPRSIRLTLSIWSCLVMISLGIVQIVRLDRLPSVESTINFGQATGVFLSYFLVGASLFYFIYNLSLILYFLPSRDRFFNKAYFSGVQQLTKDHIERVSTAQVYRWQAMLGVVIVAVIYIYNHNHPFLPRHTVIWAMLVLLPWGMQHLERIYQHNFSQKKDRNFYEMD